MVIDILYVRKVENRISYREMESIRHLAKRLDDFIAEYDRKRKQQKKKNC